MDFRKVIESDLEENLDENLDEAKRFTPEERLKKLRTDWFKINRDLDPTARDWSDNLDPKYVKKLKKGIDLINEFFWDGTK